MSRILSLRLIHAMHALTSIDTVAAKPVETLIFRDIF